MMKARIDMVGVLTSQFAAMLSFYRDVLGFKVLLEMDGFAEFENEGVRFALSTNAVMLGITEHKSYTKPRQGHGFELAFRSTSPQEVDTDYAALIEKGAIPIKGPADMPWGQRTAFFADPDDNIHEIFADLRRGA